ncbi:hypothetical protein ACFLVU_01340, partial [Chloroflexota bacterium]
MDILMGILRRGYFLLNFGYSYITHIIAKMKKTNFFEDYVRVYPDGIAFNRFGIKKEATKNNINNFLNHYKVYKFAAQFVKDKRVVDAGCGSGYGCELFKLNGAASVCGSDISKHSISFARA